MTLLDALLDAGPGQNPRQHAAVLLLFDTLQQLARANWRSRRLGFEETEEAIQNILLRLVRAGPRRHLPGNHPTTDAGAAAFLRHALHHELVTLWRKGRHTVPWIHDEPESGPSTPRDYPSDDPLAAPEDVVGMEEALRKARHIVFEILYPRSVERLAKATDRDGRRAALGELQAMAEEKLSREDLVVREMEATGKPRQTAYDRIQKAHVRARRGLHDEHETARCAGEIPDDLRPWVEQILGRMADRRLGE